MERFQWRCVVEIKAGFNAVSISWYYSATYADCAAYLATRQHLANKNRKIFMQHIGNKERIFQP